MSRFDALCTAVAYVIAACLGQTRRDLVHARMRELVRQEDGFALAADLDTLAAELARKEPVVEAARTLVSVPQPFPVANSVDYGNLYRALRALDHPFDGVTAG